MKTLRHIILAAGILSATSCVKDLKRTSPTPGNTLSISGTDRVAGPINDTLRIYGTGYNTDTTKDKVTIAGIKAPIISVTADGTEIMARIPPRAFNGSIALTVDDQTLQGPKFQYLITTGIVSTFAGSGSKGFADGQGKNAQFDSPFALTMDTLGYLYVVDAGNYRIRAINTKDSTVRTIVGNGQVGNVGGPGKGAEFTLVTGIAVSWAGYLYMGDDTYDVIRATDIAGVNVSTVAGVPLNPGDINGAAAQAKFNDPTAVCFDNNFNLLILEAGNKEVRKMSIGQMQVSPYFKLASNAAYPQAIAFNAPDGEMAIADDGNNSISIYNKDGALSVSFGSSSAGGYQDGIKGATVKFNVPEGVAYDNNYDIFVADSKNNCIRMIDNQWNTTTLVGDHTSFGLKDGTGIAAKFNSPFGVVFDKVNYYLYVTDTGNNCIRKVILE